MQSRVYINTDGVHMIYNIVTTLQNSLRAVSYTHLDVYKRQVWNSEIQKH